MVYRRHPGQKRKHGTGASAKTSQNTSGCRIKPSCVTSVREPGKALQMRHACCADLFLPQPYLSCHLVTAFVILWFRPLLACLIQGGAVVCVSDKQQYAWELTDRTMKHALMHQTRYSITRKNNGNQGNEHGLQ